jgi:ABC-type sugar transport system permease subunit
MPNSHRSRRSRVRTSRVAVLVWQWTPLMMRILLAGLQSHPGFRIDMHSHPTRIQT